jgi:hypothetical protein
VADPQSFNRYSYVGNDPVNAVDPAGLFTVCVQQGVERSLDGGKTWFVISSQNICFGGPGFAGTFDQALRTALGFWQGSSQGAGAGQGKRKASDCDKFVSELADISKSIASQIKDGGDWKKAKTMAGQFLITEGALVHSNWTAWMAHNGSRGISGFKGIFTQGGQNQQAYSHSVVSYMN